MRSRQSETLRLFILAAILAALALWAFSAGLSSQAPARIDFGRAAGLQPYFDGGFPHGVDQWISAAGTSWATMALTLASQAPAANSISSARTHLH